MNDRDLRRYNRLTAVQTFCRERASDLKANSRAQQIINRIDQHVAALEQAKADQRPERVDKTAFMKPLTDLCRNIATTARAIKQHDPGFQGSYALPRTTTENKLLTHADGLLTKLEDQPDDTEAEKAAKAELRTRFSDYALPADFVNLLRHQREAVRNANQINQRETQDGVENTRLITRILTAANTDIQDLDAMMTNLYRTEIEKLTAWQRASRIEAAPKRGAKAMGADTGNPPATPTAPGSGTSAQS